MGLHVEYHGIRLPDRAGDRLVLLRRAFRIRRQAGAEQGGDDQRYGAELVLRRIGAGPGDDADLRWVSAEWLANWSSTECVAVRAFIELAELDSDANTLFPLQQPSGPD